MRCNFVDLYYALYGAKQPSCLVTKPSSSLSSLPKIPKLSAIERKTISPIVFKAENEPEHVPYPVVATPDIKMEEELIIDDNKFLDVVDLPQVWILPANALFWTNFHFGVVN